jgi:hypothetical protein
MTTEEKKPGVYMRLLHGRLDPNERLKTWGFDGPVLGPFEAVHFTYKWHIRCFPQGQGDEIEFEFYDDLLVYDGKYYGDFEIVGEPSS